MSLLLIKTELTIQSLLRAPSDPTAPPYSAELLIKIDLSILRILSTKEHIASPVSFAELLMKMEFIISTLVPSIDNAPPHFSAVLLRGFRIKGNF